MEEQDWHAVQISSLMVSEGIELFDVWWLLLIFDSKATIYNQNLTACQAVPFMVVPGRRHSAAFERELIGLLKSLNEETNGLFLF